MGRIRALLGFSLIKSSGIYTLSSFISAAVPFILIPVLTRVLSPEDYGVLSMFSIVLALIGHSVDFYKK